MRDWRVGVINQRLMMVGHKIAKWLLIIFLVTNVTYVTLGAIHTPLHHIDVIASWGYKALALYQHDWNLEFLTNWQGEFAHPQYPILLPIIFTSLYHLIGSVQPIVPSLLSPLIYVLILIFCYKVLRKLKFNFLFSLFGTYVCSMFPSLIAQAGREHAMMADIYLCLLYWLGVWVMLNAKSKPYLWWWLVPLVIVGSLIKTEGILLVTFLLFSPQTKQLKLTQIGIASLGLIGWQVLLNWLQIPSSYAFGVPNLFEIGSRLIIVLGESITELFGNLRNWYFFWWLYLAAFTLFPLSWFYPQKKLIKIMTAIMIAWIGMYLFASIPIVGYVSSSLDRLLLQTLSLWYLIFILQIASICHRLDRDGNGFFRRAG